KPSAWPVISERGLFPKAGEAAVLLWRDREQALKIGRRQWPQPVVVAVKTGPALSGGTLFRPYSELLWLTGRVEARFLAGPPTPPKEEAPSRGAKDDRAAALPGSFYLETPPPEVHRGKKKGKHGDAPDWKNQIRRDRRRHGE
ncbi:MAG: hypothetical protein LBS31_12855, partial [Candidatus Adiutrix sp.]|nr:hypothetical protein [Candidatus Adiutrix sp.]